MSERALHILLDELKTIRLVCKKCGTAVDFSIEAMATPPNRGVNCPGCGSPIRHTRAPIVHRPDAFEQLAAALRALHQLQGHAVEFIIPAK